MFDREELEAIDSALRGLDEEYGLYIPHRSAVFGDSREEVQAAYEKGQALIQRIEEMLRKETDGTS